MASQMPVVNVEFGDRPTIEFPSETAPAGLKVVELLEGNGPMVRRGDTVTVNYHGVAQRRFPLGGIHSAGVWLWFPWRSAGRHRRRRHPGVRDRHHLHPLKLSGIE